MKKKTKNYLHFFLFLYNIIRPIWDLRKTIQAIKHYPKFFNDLLHYKMMFSAEKIKLIDICPVLEDRTKTTPFDQHYFYQDIWTARKIIDNKTEHHIDVGSRIDLVGFLSTLTNITSVDIRPLEVKLKNFKSIKGDILSLPFSDDSVSSLSCLHVVEHVGLGRYGDALNPLGTKKACQELARVLAKGGNLYFSLPVGKPRLCFNAHRIHAPKQIIKYFNGLKLVEFSGIDDEGNFNENIKPEDLENQYYACGLFWFKKL